MNDRAVFPWRVATARPSFDPAHQRSTPRAPDVIAEAVAGAAAVGRDPARHARRCIQQGQRLRRLVRRARGDAGLGDDNIEHPPVALGDDQEAAGAAATAPRPGRAVRNSQTAIARLSRFQATPLRKAGA
jgi:hypothetical protein